MNAPAFTPRIHPRLPEGEATYSDVRPAFAEGQVWAAREPEFGEWTIVAITEHPTRPIVAQARHGGTADFNRDGRLSDHQREHPLDLVALVSEAPDYATECA